jgi:XRE family transcriptional regulator, fatty acid utilization regulator
VAIREENIRMILGLKIRQLRQDRQLSLNEVSQKTGISVSYLNEIEKGKKRPKADKIVALAELFEVSYDWLISLKLSKKLSPLADLLHSNILNELPLEVFGLEPANLLEIFSNAPSKLNAFVSTLIEINRSYDMSVEHFYFSVLRSYQEMHENYFEDLEQFAADFRNQFQINQISDEHRLRAILEEEFHYEIRFGGLDEYAELHKLRSVVIPGEKPVLLLNSQLDEKQRIFILGREIGYQYMQLNERPYTSSWVEVKSFEQVLNNFKASYFSSALLIPKQSFIRNIQEWFKSPQFDDQFLLNLINHYNATPETLFHRLTNLLPEYFGINQLFFLRFSYETENETFHLTKEMHLSGLHNPHATLLKEHYCRRWISLSIIKDGLNQADEKPHICKIQRSKYINSNREYLVIAINHKESSISIGLLINHKLKNKIEFLKDTRIQNRKVNETCERCGAINCQERVAPPVLLKQQKEMEQMKSTLKNLLTQPVNA